jgi:hypothetical protein
MERDALAAIRRAGFGLVAPRHFTLLRVLDPETAGTRLSDLARDSNAGTRTDLGIRRARESPRALRDLASES